MIKIQAHIIIKFDYDWHFFCFISTISDSNYHIIIIEKLDALRPKLF